ncbi:hypothetical protein [Streptomyces sp. NTH33]|uniref:hypothetical protein n=1 Tax=Streptomyces sp. NTH33 TaxID=1735453 RepID=UPI0011B94AC1|nr:hypothetical protein [Streptomyces sp. NTH33]
MLAGFATAWLAKAGKAAGDGSPGSSPGTERAPAPDDRMRPGPPRETPDYPYDKEAASETGQHIKQAATGSAQQTAHEVKDTAAQAVRATADQAKDQAGQVTAQARQSGQTTIDEARPPPAARKAAPQQRQPRAHRPSASANDQTSRGSSEILSRSQVGFVVA